MGGIHWMKNSTLQTFLNDILVMNQGLNLEMKDLKKKDTQG